jgi:xylulose-5-phosphate/fructose-6-phosphate phosphoketolase
VRGYKEEGTTTTPFDMCVLNEIDRYHLVLSTLARVEILNGRREEVKTWTEEKLKEHKNYIQTYGQDMPEIRNWSFKKG